MFQSYSPHNYMLIQISITIISSPQPRKLNKVGLFPMRSATEFIWRIFNKRQNKRSLYTYLIWLMAHKLICTLAQRKAKPIRQVWVFQLFLGKAKTLISISFNCPWFCGRLTGVPLWVECGYYESSRGIGALWSLV